MKNLTLLFAVILLTTSSCKKLRNKNATVIQDCTGTYLKVDGKKYSVCNFSMLSTYKDGEEVTATFKKVEECESTETRFVCLLLVSFDSLIEVQKIK